jgi:hypothetical protein
MPPAARGGGGSGAIRAGRSFVELFLKDASLYKSLDAAQARLKAFGSFTTKLGLATTAAGSAVLAPLVKVFGDAVTRGAAIDALSRRFALTTESVSALAYAFEKSGGSLDEFDGTLTSLAAKVKGAADANEELVDGLKGLNGRALIRMPLDQQVDRIADAFSRITNPIDQATVAQDLFGASGLRMLDVLKRGSGGLAAWKKEAVSRGAVLSQEDATRATTAMRAYTDTMLAVRLAIGEVGKALVGGSGEVKGFSDSVIAAIQTARGWVANNREAIVTFAKIAGAVTAGGAALLVLGPVAAAAGSAVGFLLVGVKLAAAAFAVLLSPVGLTVAAVAALGGAFRTQTSAGTGFVESVRGAFGRLSETASATWGGIVAAFQSGDLQKAFDVAVAGLRVAWLTVVDLLQEKWVWFEQNILSGLKKIAADIEAMYEKLKKVLGTTGGGDTAARLAGGYAVAKVAPAVLRAAGMGARFLGPVGLVAGLAATQIPWEKVFGGGGGGKADDAAAERDKAAAGANAELDAAAAELKRLLGEINDPAARQNRLVQLGPDPAELRRNVPMPKVPNQQELFNNVKGAFAIPFARMQLGYGDQASKRQLDALQGIEKHAAALPEIRDAIKDNAPKFK